MYVLIFVWQNRYTAATLSKDVAMPQELKQPVTNQNVDEVSHSLVEHPNIDLQVSG